ncbi:FAD/NAD(P)-binding domain-containing protein [Aureobasidium sp. EXF-12298]|nr:FAD/NAD(P)-binding domain-containing protein [Aureobasidium sp. EXF-12298]KAI4756164.1 FAD/NAD(P)-binding domain-containing protein [Aureobasidium sp. EXF-12344]KAI4777996.1 FAD/NAD(P)-binding domain-containing protein [Aureobasidium sp. EXF-3400]
MLQAEKKRVAIVGSGCAGLGAAWALQNTNHEVHIFEKSDRLGGHTNTQTFTHGKHSTPVDTGFIVMNSATYPNLIRFLNHVKVDIVPTLMTFSVSRNHGEFEWSGSGEGIFAQRENIFKPRMWRMIFDIIRFNQFALDLLTDDDSSRTDQTIGDYLNEQGYSQAFKDDYLIPMTAAVWSTSPDKTSLEFPVLTLVRFMWNHHLLSTIAARPTWLTIKGGSQKYIDAILRSSDKKRFHFHTSTPITGVTRMNQNGKAVVEVSYKSPLSGTQESSTFDHVIMACHGDDILPLLSAKSRVPPSEKEEEILGAFQTSENVAYLHSDLSLMPLRRQVFTAWNYLTTSAPSKLEHPAGVSLTYWMNLLQHLPESKFGPVLVTMNPPHEPAPEHTQGKFIYRHPLYTPAAVKSQNRLNEIQNTSGISYCGAWTKYGFHEDGFSSGLKVAIDHLGATLPFEFKDSTFSRGKAPQLNSMDHAVRTAIIWIMRFAHLVHFFLSLPPVAFVLSIFLGILDRILGIKIKLE